MLGLIFKVWMAATLATMSISYGLHSVRLVREAVQGFTHKDGLDH